MPITYDPVANVITVTGFTESVPCTFTDIYDADKAGTLSLHDRNGITGVDAGPVPVDRAERPADYKELGSYCIDLYIVVENSVNMSNATIKVVGTDRCGTDIEENIATTGDGTYYCLTKFATVSSTYVIVFNGTGSFDYELFQGQWGVVWKTNDAQLMFNAKLVIGDGSIDTWFVDTLKQIMIEGITGTWMTIKGKTTVTFGVLEDASLKTTSRGVAFYANSISPIEFIRGINLPTTISLYSCYFSGDGNDPRHSVYITGKIYNCVFTNSRWFGASTPGYEIDAYNVEVNKSTYGWWYSTQGTFQKIRFTGPGSIGVYLWSTMVFSIKDLEVKGAWSNPIRALSITTDKYMVNADLESWDITWAGTSIAGIYRQYEFEVHCQDKDGNDLSGVSVVAEYISPYGQAFSTTTDVNGDISTQTVDHGWFDEANGNTEQLKTPLKVTYSKAGYQTVVKYYNLDEKTKDVVVLHKAVGVFISLGTPVVNLKKTDPENKNVMVVG